MSEIIQKIHLKTETTETQFRAISNQIDIWGNLLADGIDDGGYYVIVHFDDGLDFLAFLVATGGAVLHQDQGHVSTCPDWGRGDEK